MVVAEQFADAARVWDKAQVVNQAPGNGGLSPALAMVQQAVYRCERSFPLLGERTV